MNKENPWHMLAVLSTLGTEVVLLSIGGGWLGNKLDVMWSVGPLFLFIGIILGLGCGFLSAFLTLRMVLKDDSNEEDR